ncbi:hypothetical protein V1290_002527 [Bradyrhizobium sp. AZCC 1578]|uniref:DUF6345 domain-containing protein n=1 Tax=Bradyrhizobium sp. AZCC 1578 TaxID=3117027 RepID=UPI00303581B4
MSQSSLRSILFLVIVFWPVSLHAQLRYSTGGVSNYPASCGGADLPLSVPEARNFQGWYNLAGFSVVSRWENGDVWGSDFRDGTSGTNDTEPQGGSDLPEVYFFSGHGICQNPPTSGTGDFIATCGTFGKPDVTRIGTSSRWGNTGGRLQFMFIDASCPMDLPSLVGEWFASFRGLHMATGHSGDVNHDTFDSSNRGSQFAAYTTGVNLPDPLGTFFFYPQLSVGDAWMTTGLIDVQPQVCAVALASGNDRDDAINRRENEFITSGFGNPTPNWFAWRWVCN